MGGLDGGDRRERAVFIIGKAERFHFLHFVSVAWLFFFENINVGAERTRR